MKVKDCTKCHAKLMHYYVKDGLCNACRNPHLVVTSKVNIVVQEIVNSYLTELSELDVSADYDLISDLANSYQYQHKDLYGVYESCVSAALNPRY